MYPKTTFSKNICAFLFGKTLNGTIIAKRENSSNPIFTKQESTRAYREFISRRFQSVDSFFICYYLSTYNYKRYAYEKKETNVFSSQEFWIFCKI